MSTNRALLRFIVMFMVISTLINGGIIAMFVLIDYNPYAVSYDDFYVRDVNGDGVRDALFFYDRRGGSSGERVVSLVAYSGKDLKMLWSEALPKNLGAEYSGVIELFWFDDVLVQHWYTGVGFMKMPTRELRFVEEPELLESPCLTERGVIAMTRQRPTMKLADPVTMTLRPQEVAAGPCLKPREGDRWLKEQCEALGGRCAQILPEPAPLTLLEEAKRSARSDVRRQLKDRLVMRSAGGVLVRVQADGAGASRLVASDARGATLWRLPLGPEDDWTVSGDRVLVMTRASYRDSAVRAINASDGAEQWRFKGNQRVGPNYRFKEVEAAGSYAFIKVSWSPTKFPEHGVIALRLDSGVPVSGSWGAAPTPPGVVDEALRWVNAP